MDNSPDVVAALITEDPDIICEFQTGGLAERIIALKQQADAYLPGLVQRIDQSLDQATQIAQAPDKLTRAQATIPFDKAAAAANLTSRHAQNIVNEIPPLEKAIVTHAQPAYQEEEWETPEDEISAEQHKANKLLNKMNQRSTPQNAIETNKLPTQTPDKPRGVGLSSPSWKADASTNTKINANKQLSSPQRRGGLLQSLRRPWDRLRGVK